MTTLGRLFQKPDSDSPSFSTSVVPRSPAWPPPELCPAQSPTVGMPSLFASSSVVTSAPDTVGAVATGAGSCFEIYESGNLDADHTPGFSPALRFHKHMCDSLSTFFEAPLLASLSSFPEIWLDAH